MPCRFSEFQASNDVEARTLGWVGEFDHIDMSNDKDAALRPTLADNINGPHPKFNLSSQ